jgi:hypothetical protein
LVFSARQAEPAGGVSSLRVPLHDSLEDPPPVAVPPLPLQTGGVPPAAVAAVVGRLCAANLPPLRAASLSLDDDGDVAFFPCTPPSSLLLTPSLLSTSYLPPTYLLSPSYLPPTYLLSPSLLLAGIPCSFRRHARVSSHHTELHPDW